LSISLKDLIRAAKEDLTAGDSILRSIIRFEINLGNLDPLNDEA